MTETLRLDQWWHHKQVTWIPTCADELGMCAFRMKERVGKEGVRKQRAVRDVWTP